MLLEELRESGDRDVEGVVAVVVLQACEVRLFLNTPRGLERPDLWLGLLVDIIL